jgi:hypothetical protein
VTLRISVRNPVHKTPKAFQMEWNYNNEGGAMISAKSVPVTSIGKVYCPICTHTVDATLEPEPKGKRRHNYVRPGQKCPRCSGSLDAGYIIDLESAA